MTLLLILILILLLCGGGWGYSTLGSDFHLGGGLIGLLFVVVLLYLIFHW